MVKFKNPVGDKGGILEDLKEGKEYTIESVGDTKTVDQADGSTVQLIEVVCKRTDDDIHEKATLWLPANEDVTIGKDSALGSFIEGLGNNSEEWVGKTFVATLWRKFVHAITPSSPSSSSKQVTLDQKRARKPPKEEVETVAEAFPDEYYRCVICDTLCKVSGERPDKVDSGMCNKHWAGFKRAKALDPKASLEDLIKATKQLVGDE